MKIKDINKNNQNVEIIARVERVINMQGNNNANYLIVYLSDDTGRFEGRLWNCSVEDVVRLVSNRIYEIKGQAVLYKQQMQLKISYYSEIGPQDLQKIGIDEKDFIIKAPINVDTNFNKMIQIIETVKNPTYRVITLELLKQNEEIYKTYPAAISIHHNVAGGLLWHSYSLLVGAQLLRQVYEYATIDWDLVFCGCILHDIGKIVEMNRVVADEYTFEGKLLGHISIGNELIAAKARELNIYKKGSNLNYDVVKLQHMVLSSHGKNEYGSPIEPLLLEGVILSTLDNLDGRIFKINEELNKIDHNKWTQKIISEEGKCYLKHFEKNKYN